LNWEATKKKKLWYVFEGRKEERKKTREASPELLVGDGLGGAGVAVKERKKEGWGVAKQYAYHGFR